METTRLSSKGQVIIPKSIRNTHQWSVGQEFTVEEIDNGILFKPKTPFPKATVKDVAGCLKYNRLSKSIKQMNDAIRKGVRAQWRDRD